MMARRRVDERFEEACISCGYKIVFQSLSSLIPTWREQVRSARIRVIRAEDEVALQRKFSAQAVEVKFVLVNEKVDYHSWTFDEDDTVFKQFLEPKKVWARLRTLSESKSFLDEVSSGLEAIGLAVEKARVWERGSFDQFKDFCGLSTGLVDDVVEVACQASLIGVSSDKSETNVDLVFHPREVNELKRHAEQGLFFVDKDDFYAAEDGFKGDPLTARPVILISLKRGKKMTDRPLVKAQVTYVVNRFVPGQFVVLPDGLEFQESIEPEIERFDQTASEKTQEGDAFAENSLSPDSSLSASVQRISLSDDPQCGQTTSTSSELPSLVPSLPSIDGQGKRCDNRFSSSILIPAAQVQSAGSSHISRVQMARMRASQSVSAHSSRSPSVADDACADEVRSILSKPIDSSVHSSRASSVTSSKSATLLDPPTPSPRASLSKKAKSKKKYVSLVSPPSQSRPISPAYRPISPAASLPKPSTPYPPLSSSFISVGPEDPLPMLPTPEWTDQRDPEEHYRSVMLPKRMIQDSAFVPSLASQPVPRNASFDSIFNRHSGCGVINTPVAISLPMIEKEILRDATMGDTRLGKRKLPSCPETESFADDLPPPPPSMLESLPPPPKRVDLPCVVPEWCALEEARYLSWGGKWLEKSRRGLRSRASRQRMSQTDLRVLESCLKGLEHVKDEQLMEVLKETVIDILTE
uniref:VP7 n=1 Tax=Shelly headland virus TaxID=2485879 RepID=A0A3G3BTI7_9VIRU|nr:VP7 [Shelly headland virus]